VVVLIIKESGNLLIQEIYKKQLYEVREWERSAPFFPQGRRYLNRRSENPGLVQEGLRSRQAVLLKYH